MAEEDAQVGAVIASNAQPHQQPPDAGGGSERITKLQQLNNNNNNNNNNKISQPVVMPRKGEAKFIMASSHCETDLLLSNKKKIPLQQQQQRTMNDVQSVASDSEEGFLSTSPDSTNGEVMSIDCIILNRKILLQNNNNTSCDVKLTTTTTTAAANMTTTTVGGNCGGVTTTTTNNKTSGLATLFECTNPSQCVTLRNILDSFKAPLSEEHAWALIYQFMTLYRCASVAQLKSSGERHIFNELELPDTLHNLNLHRDGTVHCSWTQAEFIIKEQNVKQQQQQQQSECDRQEERGEEFSALFLSTQKKMSEQTSDAAMAQCRLCPGRHGLKSCPIFRAMTPAHRREVVTKHECCVNCLAHSHRLEQGCGNLNVCRKCQQVHNTLLHDPATGPPRQADPSTEAARNPPRASPQVTQRRPARRNPAPPRRQQRGQRGTAPNQARGPRGSTRSHAQWRQRATHNHAQPPARLSTTRGVETADLRGRTAFKLIGEALWTLARR